MASDILTTISLDPHLGDDMTNDAYTLYGYKNFIRLRSSSVAPGSGGEIHLILESNTIANAAALSALYSSAPAGSLIFATQKGVGVDGATFFGKELATTVGIAPFTMGTLG